MKQHSTTRRRFATAAILCLASALLMGVATVQPMAEEAADPAATIQVSDFQERGVVLKGGIGMSLRDLYEERLPLYERYADYVVNIDDLSITAAARKVADALK